MFDQTKVMNHQTPSQAQKKASVAVLPFLNLNDDLEEEYFSDGITEEIINLLSRVPDLQVAGRTSSFAFKRSQQDLGLIGQQLHVAHALVGSVRWSATQLHITAKLVQIEGEKMVWSQEYERALSDIFDIQDEIALAILKEIQVQLLGDVSTSTFKRYTNNAEAYQQYLHGRFYHNKFATASEYNKAIGYFQEAIKLEPSYAIAYAGIASCYLNMWFYRQLPAATALPLMREATQRALSLDETIAESYLAMARMQMLYEWNFEQAAVSFAKALELNWETAELHGQYALFCALTGRVDKAKQHVEQALFLEPFSIINNFYAGYVYWITKYIEKAVGQGYTLVELDPSFWGGYMILGLNLITLKDFLGSQEALETAMEMNYNGITLSACGALFGLSNEPESARDILTQMMRLSQTQVVSNYDLGIVNACIGEKDTAYAYFEKAIDLHEPPMLFFEFIIRDWLSGALFDERYMKLAARIKKV